MIIVSTFLALSASALASTPPAFETRPCTSPAPSSTAKCGVVRVPEDRSNPTRRKIDLNVIVLPAKPAPARLPPLFDIDGGPGLNATKNAEFYASNGVSAGRDVVLVDQRGTGKSNPLSCPELAAMGPNVPMLAPAAVKRCRDALSANADLRFYGTFDAVHDLDDVRRALGYDKIDLFGLSYGTTVALRYMRHFPQRVRAALLMGTSPPTAMPPQHHATAGARALELLLADCSQDEACNGRFPQLRGDLANARRWLASGTGPMSTELFMERLRTMFYSTDARAGVPLLIERAANQDLSALLAAPPGSGPAVADGMFLAVTCGEGLDMMNYEPAATAARATMMGDYRLRRQRDACSDWPKVRVARDHVELPTNSQASVLLVSGEWDPVAPPNWAERTAGSLPRARHIVIQRGAHILDGMSGLETCLDPILVAFLNHGNAEKLDTSCVATMKAPAYRLTNPRPSTP